MFSRCSRHFTFFQRSLRCLTQTAQAQNLYCPTCFFLKLKKRVLSILSNDIVDWIHSRGTMFKKGVKSLMRMGKQQRNSQDKDALMDSDDSAQMTAIALQRGHTTETSDLSSDNESVRSLNAEYPAKPKK